MLRKVVEDTSTSVRPWDEVPGRRAGLGPVHDRGELAVLEELGLLAIPHLGRPRAHRGRVSPFVDRLLPREDGTRAWP